MMYYDVTLEIDCNNSYCSLPGKKIKIIDNYCVFEIPNV